MLSFAECPEVWWLDVSCPSRTLSSHAFTSVLLLELWQVHTNLSRTTSAFQLARFLALTTLSGVSDRIMLWNPHKVWPPPLHFPFGYCFGLSPAWNFPRETDFCWTWIDRKMLPLPLLYSLALLLWLVTFPWIIYITGGGGDSTYCHCVNLSWIQKSSPCLWYRCTLDTWPYMVTLIYWRKCDKEFLSLTI